MNNSEHEILKYTTYLSLYLTLSRKNILNENKQTSQKQGQLLSSTVLL